MSWKAGESGARATGICEVGFQKALDVHSRASCPVETQVQAPLHRAQGLNTAKGIFKEPSSVSGTEKVLISPSFFKDMVKPTVCVVLNPFPDQLHTGKKASLFISTMSHTKQPLKKC